MKVAQQGILNHDEQHKNCVGSQKSVNEDGNLVDVRLSEKRDMEAAKAFFAQAHEIGLVLGKLLPTAK